MVIGKKITTETPVLLGTSGVNGCLIYAIDVRALGVNPATTIKLFTKFLGDTEYFIELELDLTEATSSPSEIAANPPSTFVLPKLLPTATRNTGLHLPAECSLYAALSASVNDGVLVIVRGGNY